MRLTPENITEIKENEIFVFGSNLSGRHGRGAAHIAYHKFGAVRGIGVGLHGNSYAIPTKDQNLKTLPLEIICHFVDNFIELTKTEPKLIFLVTEIGCGLAGYTPESIAPLFEKARHCDNIYLPRKFWEVLL